MRRLRTDHEYLWMNMFRQTTLQSSKRQGTCSAKLRSGQIGTSPYFKPLPRAEPLSQHCWLGLRSKLGGLQQGAADHSSTFHFELYMSFSSMAQRSAVSTCSRQSRQSGQMHMPDSFAHCAHASGIESPRLAIVSGWWNLVQTKYCGLKGLGLHALQCTWQYGRVQSN